MTRITGFTDDAHQVFRKDPVVRTRLPDGSAQRAPLNSGTSWPNVPIEDQHCTRRWSPRLAALALALSACAGLPEADLPDKLKPPANESLAMVVPAKGVQIYECRPAIDATKYEWVFVAPEAQLYDARGKRIGSHGAGPSWQADDGSRVLGTLKERVNAPTADAIPWLLLSTKPAGPEGAFSRVTSIQRVKTVGGVPPSKECTRELAGTTTRIGYTADYRLFTPR